MKKKIHICNTMIYKTELKNNLSLLCKYNILDINRYQMSNKQLLFKFIKQ